MKRSHILRDFNGTLLNNVEIGIESANILLTRHGIKPLNNIDEYRKVFCFPIIEYYKNLGFNFDKTPYEDLALEWVEIYNSISHKAMLYDNADNALSFIKESGVPQFILSATEKTMLHRQAQELKISEYFDDILGTGDIYAYSKKDIAVAWKNKVLPQRALLIGDTVHDAEVAEAAGFDCILIANGHENKEKLLKSGVIIIDSINDIFDFLK